MAGGDCILTRLLSALENAEICHNSLGPEKPESMFNIQELCVCVCVYYLVAAKQNFNVYMYVWWNLNLQPPIKLYSVIKLLHLDSRLH